ncbi:MAG TPA: dephospho-CoA kinase [Pirellulales bacterium]|jgi:dephospho-CoA kinase|nr:dephospho-CoA kinase [Pirellulales bacterium]
MREEVIASIGVPLVGIAGGVASGKSLVTERLGRLGGAVISADQLAHEVLRYENVKRLARDRWGEGIFDGQGEIDRRALAKIVFAPPPDGPRELKFWEQCTHPEIGRLALERIERLAADKSAVAIILDVPLLFESGWNKFCEKTVFVDTPPDLRRKRAIARGWTAEDFARREAVQESLETKRRLADVVIDNSGSVESTQAQIEHFWHSLIRTPLPR